MADPCATFITVITDGMKYAFSIRHLEGDTLQPLKME